MLRAFLKGKLPPHMVPGIFTMLDSLPLTANGKVDRRALPDPKPAEQPAEGFVGPRTPTEELVAAAWCQALKLPRVSMGDNFFELGGHSLPGGQGIRRTAKDRHGRAKPRRYLQRADGRRPGEFDLRTRSPAPGER